MQSKLTAVHRDFPRLLDLLLSFSAFVCAAILTEQFTLIHQTFMPQTITGATLATPAAIFFSLLAITTLFNHLGLYNRLNSSIEVQALAIGKVSLIISLLLTVTGILSAGAISGKLILFFTLLMPAFLILGRIAFGRALAPEYERS